MVKGVEKQMDRQRSGQMITKEIHENQMDVYVEVVYNQIKFVFDRLVMVLI